MSFLVFVSYALKVLIEGTGIKLTHVCRNTPHLQANPGKYLNSTVMKQDQIHLTNHITYTYIYEQNFNLWLM